MEYDRNETIAAIRTNLRARGLKWVSVTGGRGTAYGWITIKAMPSKGRDRYGNLTDEQKVVLGEALGLEGPAHVQGVNIPASTDYRKEYVARSKGETPVVIGMPYWD